MTFLSSSSSNSSQDINISKDHLPVFRLIAELSFPVGKKLLVASLRGEKTSQIKRLQLHKHSQFGVLGGYSSHELLVFIDYLLEKNFLHVEKKQGKFLVLVLAKQALEELRSVKTSCKIDEIYKEYTAGKKEDCVDLTYTSASLNEKEEELCCNLQDFFEGFTNEQKKAVVSNHSRQLCIAGAGSGKTRVLTYKIVYLIKYCGVLPEKILAVTFTRKAKQEMKKRLAVLLPNTNIRIETFNSFSEKELIKHGNSWYGSKTRTVSSKEYNHFIISSLAELGYDLDMFLEHYFTSKERQGKEQRQLLFSFLYDFKTIMQAAVFHADDESYFEKRLDLAPLSQRITAKTLVRLTKMVLTKLRQQHLRTFADQILDCVRLYTTNPTCKPDFEWLLIDEFQDVNPLQVQLVNLLAPKNVFMVGDPRQSIYAWRGSDPDMIFSSITNDTQVVELTNNFRSTKPVVEFANEIIAQAKRKAHPYKRLVAKDTREGRVVMMKHKSEDEEALAIIDIIGGLACPRKDIFVLARTNKQLQRFEDLCIQRNISFLLRTDEQTKQNISAHDDQITLSTVHAIKGLEAEFVFVVGADFKHYPCKSKDHTYVDMLAGKPNYNVVEEERRLLYVACTRAKKELFISYVGGPSYFLTPSVQAKATDVFETQKTVSKDKVDVAYIEQQRESLRRWRYLEAQDRGIPPYMVFTDKALESLLAMQPLEVEELLHVTGLGRAKITEFGEDILHILHGI
ncbi:MAG: UvrD-helicase domain-containing protein [Candidatus Nanoarchaeia archaeon]